MSRNGNANDIQQRLIHGIYTTILEMSAIWLAQSRDILV